MASPVDIAAPTAPAARRARLLTPAPWLIALPALLLLLISYQSHRVTLLGAAPYEAWDEVNTYNNAPLLGDEAASRSPAYGTLDTAKFAVASWYYHFADPIGKVRRFVTYSNNVQPSWTMPGFDIHMISPRNWGRFAVVEYGFFRGIPDRRPILIAREINLACIYLLAAAMILSTAALFGWRAIFIYAAYVFLSTSATFYYGSDFCLPTADCAVLSFFIMALCLAAVYLENTRILPWAAVLLAVGVNHKIDSLALGLPIAIAAVWQGYSPRRSPKDVALLAGKILLYFLAAFVVTDPYVLLTPALQIDRLAVAKGLTKGGALFGRNLGVLQAFMRVNISQTPNLVEQASPAMVVLCISVLATFSALPALLGRHLRPRQRLGSLLLVALTVAALFALPLRSGGAVYDRYFLNAWAVLLAAAGTGAAVALGGLAPHRNVTFVVACAALAACAYVDAGRIQGVRDLRLSIANALDPEFHLDIRYSRNQSTIEAIRAVRAGGFSHVLLVDQHAYIDLRAFLQADLEPVYINANIYRQVIRGLPPGRYLTLFSEGTSQLKGAEAWMGAWPEDLQGRYADYVDFLKSQPQIWHKSGPLMKLLTWAPAALDDNMSIAALSIPK